MKRNVAILGVVAVLLTLALPGVVGAAAQQVVAGKEIAGHGTLLVATKNDMTLYTFDKDVKGSGTSNCTGGCLTTWPALTIASGDTPTGGPGVTGTLGTITRADDGTLQVTYDGLPLYFFAKDTAPGDTNGIYTNWRAVQLAAASATPKATPPVTSTAPGTDGQPDGNVLPVLLVAALAGLGFVATIRRLATTRS